MDLFWYIIAFIDLTLIGLPTVMAVKYYMPVHQEKKKTKKGFIKVGMIDPDTRTKQYFFKKPDDNGFIELEVAGEKGKYKVAGNAIIFSESENDPGILTDVIKEEVVSKETLAEQAKKPKKDRVFKDAKKSMFYNAIGTPCIDFIQGVTHPITYDRKGQSTASGDVNSGGFSFLPIDAEDLWNLLDLEHLKGYNRGKNSVENNKIGEYTLYAIVGVGFLVAADIYLGYQIMDKVTPLQTAAGNLQAIADQLKGYMSYGNQVVAGQGNAFVVPNTPPPGG